MTARSWDDLWGDERQKDLWFEPDPNLLPLLPLIEPRNNPKAVDLGCGLGRHAILLSMLGFDVTTIDASPRAVEQCEKQLIERGLPSKVCYGSVLNLPFRNCCFDVALAWNVIYHGTRKNVVMSLAEIHRTMSYKGWVLLTLISARHATFGEGKEVEPNTFLNPQKKDGLHLHWYSAENDVRSVLSDWSIESIDEKEEVVDGRQISGTWHWIILARKL